MLTVLIDGKKVVLDPSKLLGQGGEAEIYELDGNSVAKLFKLPNHPDYVDQESQRAASFRIEEHQKKLPAFPKNVPPRVVAPQKLVMTTKGKIAGYTMRTCRNADLLLRYTQKSFRQKIPSNDVVAVLRNMRSTVSLIHQAGIVIGDFNDLNVMVSAGSEADFIDADSMQFGPFKCHVYTQRFVDPLLCDDKKTSLSLVKPHNESSDWYAFNVMVFQCMLLVDPYGGVFKPRDPTKAVIHSARPLKRITVFNPDVKYPKAAVPLNTLPDDLLEAFHKTVERDVRVSFSPSLLENMRWTSCSGCGTEHARDTCPCCSIAAPKIGLKVEYRGSVRVTRVFSTSGIILRADVHNGSAVWLYHENDEFLREDSSKILSGRVDPRVQFRLVGKTTYVARAGTVAKFESTALSAKVDAGTVGHFTAFDAGDRGLVWVDGDSLYRESSLGPELVGSVLCNQTHVWAGPTFGFGFFQAGQLTRSFVFDVASGGINDSVKVRAFRGKLVDATCVFSSTRAWFLTANQENGQTVNRCSVIKADGTIEASAEAAQGDGSWLSEIRGSCATGNVLLVPTDSGIVQVKADNGSLGVVKSFPDTEPFVNTGTKLLVGNAGLYVVSKKEIVLLAIS